METHIQWNSFTAKSLGTIKNIPLWQVFTIPSYCFFSFWNVEENIFIRGRFKRFFPTWEAPFVYEIRYEQVSLFIHSKLLVEFCFLKKFYNRNFKILFNTLSCCQIVSLSSKCVESFVLCPPPSSLSILIICVH